MSLPRILLVDDQRDILRLLHATLDTLGHKLEIYEAPSGEEALLEASRHRFDLLVSDYKLPGITGVELMKKVRAKNPDVKSILITAMNDKKTRDEMIAAGAIAMFDKPIPLADFLDVVERSLGLKRTILPPEDEKVEANRDTIADLLSKLRKQVGAQAVYLLSDRGRVLERAGDLYDSSMEVSLLSAIMAIFSSGQKVSRLIHQEGHNHYHIFSGGDHDLVLIPVDALYGLLVAGEKLAERDHILDVVDAMMSVRETMERSLRLMGMPTALAELDTMESIPISASTNVLTQDIENLFSQVKKQKIKAKDADAFWDEAVEKHGNPPLHPDMISYEQAKQLGLTPQGTNPLVPKK
ncbi:MAG: response regulator [Anaerolineales bacterium]|nr:response regulator [Anaerolineales bacterium]